MSYFDVSKNAPPIVDRALGYIALRGDDDDAAKKRIATLAIIGGAIMLGLATDILGSKKHRR